MPHVSVTRDIAAPLDQLWASWDDFANIDMFNPNLNRSFQLGRGQPTGLGAERQCDLADGKNYIQEKIVAYEPRKRLVVDIYNGTLPLERALATFDFEALGADRSRVTMRMDFTPKMWPLTAPMLPLMKAQFRKLLGKLLDGNKAYVERGEIIARAA